MSRERLIILNPKAGRGRAGRQQPLIERTLRALQLPFDLERTNGPGDATRLAQQAVEAGYQQVVLIGGDGTLNEVVTGMLTAANRPTTSLGLIPIGSGNDFSRSFEGIKPDDIKGSIARLQRNQVRHIDVGRITTSDGTSTSISYMINNIGLAIDGMVAATVHDVPLLRRTAAYMAASLRALLVYRAYPMQIRFNNTKFNREFLIATITNTRWQGGGYQLTPDAKPDDGLLDLCLVDMMPIHRALMHLPKSRNGSHIKVPAVHMGQAQRVEVAFSVPTLVTSDGEVIATDARELVVEALPGVVDLVV
ncbi:MAG: diacylglycerol kinase family lipid kinase [Chloroflexaceae bacterium]|nr:diacylglycerol kinase family lipid kinase [Chloroflexaceae bacterium]NJO06879.1 diacylglycerol kinase family lipid kinase [Chloroflexaceae bacterium]